MEAVKIIYSQKKETQFKNFETELKLRGFSGATIKIYLYYNKNFLLFAKKEPKYITRKDIKTYLNKFIIKRARERTINLIISSLKAYYDGYLNKRLLTNIKRSKIPKDIPNILTKEEIEKMIESTTNPKHRLLIELLYSSGLRIGECIKLKTKDIDSNQKLIFIKKGKGKKDRYALTSKKFLQDFDYYIKTRKNNSEYLFENFNTHITIRTAQMIIKQASHRAGISKRVYPHLMRASFATHLMENDIGIDKIQKLMGHERTDTTRGYIRYKTSDIKEIKSPLD